MQKQQQKRPDAGRAALRAVLDASRGQPGKLDCARRSFNRLRLLILQQHRPLAAPPIPPILHLSPEDRDLL
jgi:hypothetical protein